MERRIGGGREMKKLKGDCGCLAAFQLVYDDKTFIEPEFCPFCGVIACYEEEEEEE
jgi:hypothetical protein